MFYWSKYMNFKEKAYKTLKNFPIFQFQLCNQVKIIYAYVENMLYSNCTKKVKILQIKFPTKVVEKC